jgi:hypothetical protein
MVVHEDAVQDCLGTDCLISDQQSDSAVVIDDDWAGWKSCRSPEQVVLSSADAMMCREDPFLSCLREGKEDA